MGGKWSEKKQSPRASWTLFFSEPFLPHVWDSVFFRPLKIISSLLSVPEIFQHQGSGNSFRGAKGSLYWFCPIQILSKCWGWSNLLFTLLPSCTMPSLTSYLGHLAFLFNLMPSCTIALLALCPLPLPLSRCLMEEGRGCGGRLCKRVEG